MTFFDNLLDEHHLILRDAAKKFALSEIQPHAYEWEESGEFPRELYRKAAESGLIGSEFPEEVGGANTGALDSVMMAEGLMYGESMGVVAGIGSAGIALPPIVQSEDASLIERFVRPAISGEKISALAITEPNTGSDVAGVQTRAVADGDHYVVNGSKMFITSGVRADFVTTLVRTSDEPHGGLSFIVIEKDFDGVSVSKKLNKTGWLASDTAELSFANVRVPKENLVGDIGSGFVTLMRNFQNERLALAAWGAAISDRALDASIAYAKERQAFGRSISKFQVTKHKLADMATKVLAAKTMVYQVARRIDAGDYLVSEVSMAKNFCAEVAMEVTYEAVQIHGGMGYMRETNVERFARDARILPIGGGTQEIMKEIIAKQMGL